MDGKKDNISKICEWKLHHMGIIADATAAKFWHENS